MVLYIPLNDWNRPEWSTFILGAADFFRDRKQTRMKWTRFEMQLKMGRATAAGSWTTKKMVPLSGIFSLSLPSKMTMAIPSNLLGIYFFLSFFLFNAYIIFQLMYQTLLLSNTCGTCLYTCMSTHAVCSSFINVECTPTCLNMLS